ncbi:MAG: bifunctional hydroxymethylpyrimidine kinase/phosphomethylpyrimidine kinase [Oscillospiraceae bacterium]|nr:bifunctional hydroxymethylpyrimidine kinase/phosphomethylpyrimidine kinase [Oscillospiraceae bacterium]
MLQQREGGAYAAVVGGVNIDIGGQSFQPLILSDSNPGRVRTSPGGVGRNIAHNLRLLGLPVRLIAAFGEDLYADVIRRSCREIGIDTEDAVTVPGEATSTYLYLADHTGEMHLAVSDMEICRFLTPDALEEKLPLLRAAGALVLDTNIPEETVRWLCTRVDVPIFADPVSVSKAEKLRPVLARLHALKPNKLEAELLSGIRIADEHDLNRAADALLETGLQQVYITMGKEGVLAADGKKRVRLSALPEVPVNTTGCGDAFMAALVWAHFRGLDAAESARAGLAAAAIAMAGRETVNPAMCEEKLLQKMKQPQ